MAAARDLSHTVNEMKLNFPRCWCSAVFAVSVATTPVAAYAMGDEEFVGPFPSWGNVKTNYGAAGDGVTDDTGAIQKGLNALSPSNPTLYFPAGTYRITQPLTLAAQAHVNVIGEDPAATTLLWAGAPGGRMLTLNGVAYSRFNRLTFNGQGIANDGIDQSWDGVTGNFDTGNEYADNVFENFANVAFACGWSGNGCAETSMLRDNFVNITWAGISMGNFNALHMFICHSSFQNSNIGITNLYASRYYDRQHRCFQFSQQLFNRINAIHWPE